MLIKKGRLRLFISLNGGFSFTCFGGKDNLIRVFEVDVIHGYSAIHIDFWNSRGIELECYRCSEYDLDGIATRVCHKFIAYLFWGVYGLDLVMKLYRNKWGIPRLSFSKEIYD